MNFPEVLEQFESDASELVVPASHPSRTSIDTDRCTYEFDEEAQAEVDRLNAILKTMVESGLPRDVT